MPIELTMSVDIGGLFDGVVQRANENAKHAFHGALTKMANEAKALAPSKHGALVASIRAGEVTGELSAGTLSGYVSASAPGAEAQEFGSGLHGERGAKYPIFPRFRKALRFPISGTIEGGEDGFAFRKGVMHPGVTAKRYLQRGVEAKMDMLTGELAAVVQLAVMDGNR